MAQLRDEKTKRIQKVDVFIITNYDSIMGEKSRLDKMDFLIAEPTPNSAKMLFEIGIYDDSVTRAYYCMYYAVMNPLVRKFLT